MDMREAFLAMSSGVSSVGAMSPNSPHRYLRYLTPYLMLTAGVVSLEVSLSPSHLAVEGSSCIRPTAPAALRALGLKVDSFCITARTSARSTPCAAASARAVSRKGIGFSAGTDL